MIESTISGKACSTELGRINIINSVNEKRRRKALLVSSGEFDTGQKRFDQKSYFLKKESDMNHSSDDKQ